MANNGATVEIPLTTDHFQCSVLYESVLAEGFVVQLLTEMPDTGGRSYASPNRLLVFESDLVGIREVLGRSFPID